jgi:Tfp pilus assembly protein PilO
MKILDQLDAFFAKQKEEEQKVFFILPLIVIGFIVYYFILPITTEILDESLRKNQELHSKINKKEMGINNFKNSIVRINNQRRILKIKIKKLSKVEVIMQNLLKKVQFLIFDLNRWAEIYNTIPTYVKNSNLLLLKLDNTLFLDDKNSNQNNNNQLVKLKMQIKIDVVGNFKNVVKFMNNFESRKDFVKIEFLKTDGMMNYLVINIYGAEL